MDSLLPDHAAALSSDPFPTGAHFDVAVVGGGLTGLTTATLALRAGARVLLLHAGAVGSPATGHTSVELSLLHGGRFGPILERYGAELTGAYLEANQLGQQWLVQQCERSGVTLEPRDAVVYSATREGEAALDAELHACRVAGLGVERIQGPIPPFTEFGGVRLSGNWQFDPVRVLRSLAEAFRAEGGILCQETAVYDVTGASPCSLETEAGQVLADRVVLATGAPVLNQGGHFVRPEPYRSCALAFEVPGDLPRALYSSVEPPLHTVRTSGSGDDECLLALSVDQEHESAPGARLAELRQWVTETFAGAELRHAWSRRQYRQAEHLPLISPIVPGDSRIYVGTGFNTWGATDAVAAGIGLASLLGGDRRVWVDTLYRSQGPPHTGPIRQVRAGSLPAIR